MKLLFQVIVAILVGGGGIFVAALLVAPLAFSIKVLAAILFVLLACGVLLLMVSQLAIAESVRIILTNRKSQDLDDELTHAELAVVKQLGAIHGGMRLGQTTRLAYLLCAMFASWIVLGWVLRQFVM